MAADELASGGTVVLGSLAFLVFWVTATFPRFPLLPIGRSAGALTAAALMVVFQVESPSHAYASIDLPILGLLFGTMLLTVYLIRAHAFTYLASILSWRCHGPKDLLFRLSVLVALASALLTNDTCCVLFTPFILNLCHHKHLPPEPFLLALASNANIGSSATPIGNPQNLVIAIQGDVSFREFVAGVFPAMILGVLVNFILLLAMFWKQLVPKVVGPVDDSFLHFNTGDTELDAEGQLRRRQTSATESLSNIPITTDMEDHHLPADVQENVTEIPSSSQTEQVSISSLKIQQGPDPLTTTEMQHASFDAHSIQTKPASSSSLSQIKQASVNEALVNSCQIEPMSVGSNLNKEVEMTPSAQLAALSIEPQPENVNGSCSNILMKWRKVLWKPCVYLVAVGMLACLIAGLDLSWCTITAAVVLVALDFRDAGPSLAKVSSSLLFFFSGMFITVDGFNRTGLPSTFWNAVEPYAQIDHPIGIAVLAAVIILLCNVVSNVPTILLLGMKVVTSSTTVSQKKAWLILAWASTVAGNLTLIGSAANIIVCEQARTAPKLQYHLSFWRHLRFGFISTLLVVAVGLPLIQG